MSNRIGPTGDLYRSPNPTAVRSSEQVDVGGVREHVAGVDESDALHAFVHRSAQLDVEDGFRISADREVRP